MTSSLTWKTDKPTTPGWYWYRESDFFLEVVHVRYQEKRLAADYKEGGSYFFWVHRSVKGRMGRPAGAAEMTQMERCYLGDSVPRPS